MSRGKILLRPVNLEVELGFVLRAVGSPRRVLDVGMSRAALCVRVPFCMLLIGLAE